MQTILKLAHCARFCFRRRKPLKKRGHHASTSCQSKGRCKKSVLLKAANSVWKPVNIILKLSSEDPYISYFFKLANINRFFETTLNTWMANPSRMFSSSTGFIRILWCHIRQNVVRPAPLSRLRSVASIPPQYAYMLLRSYYFYQRCSSQVLWRALKDDRHIASVAKTKGSPKWEAYRPRPACVNVSRFWSDAV